MFDIGWPELLIVAVVLIVVVGPKDLPSMLRTFGRTTNKLRSMAGDFRRQFDDALKEAELGDVKDIVDSARKLDPRSEIKKHLDPLKSFGDEVKSGLTDAVKAAEASEPAVEEPELPQTKDNSAADPAKTKPAIKKTASKPAKARTKAASAAAKRSTKPKSSSTGRSSTRKATARSKA